MLEWLHKDILLALIDKAFGLLLGYLLSMQVVDAGWFKKCIFKPCLMNWLTGKEGLW